MEKSMGNARRKFVGNGILAVLSSVSIARPAMGEASPIAAEGKQPYLRETLKLIDGGDLQMAEQRLTKSIGAWNDSAVDLTVLLKVRRKPQTMNWQETNNLPEVPAASRQPEAQPSDSAVPCRRSSKPWHARRST